MTYEQYTDAVVAKVTEALKDKAWFKGVCIDSIKQSYNMGKSIEKASEAAEMDTGYYDAN